MSYLVWVLIFWDSNAWLLRCCWWLAKHFDLSFNCLQKDEISQERCWWINALYSLCKNSFLSPYITRDIFKSAYSSIGRISSKTSITRHKYNIMWEHIITQLLNIHDKNSNILIYKNILCEKCIKTNRLAITSYRYNKKFQFGKAKANDILRTHKQYSHYLKAIKLMYFYNIPTRHQSLFM